MKFSKLGYMIGDLRIIGLLILSATLMNACDEPRWDEEEYVTCIENIDLNCYDYLPEMSFKGVIDGIDICYSHGVAGYTFETTSFGRTTTPANDPTLSPDTPLQGIGLRFQLLSPDNEEGWTDTKISLSTNAVHPDSFELIQFLEDLSNRDILPLEKSPEGPKLDGFKIKISKACPEFRPESLTSGSEISTTRTRSAALRHVRYNQPEDALRLRKVKISQKGGKRVYEFTFEIKNLRMYYQIDSDIHEFGTIEHAVFNTRTEVEL